MRLTRVWGVSSSFTPGERHQHRAIEIGFGEGPAPRSGTCLAFSRGRTPSEGSFKVVTEVTVVGADNAYVEQQRCVEKVEGLLVSTEEDAGGKWDRRRGRCRDHPYRPAGRPVSSCGVG
jgi:hypothetical protein